MYSCSFKMMPEFFSSSRPVSLAWWNYSTKVFFIVEIEHFQRTKVLVFSRESAHFDVKSLSDYSESFINLLIPYTLISSSRWWFKSFTISSLFIFDLSSFLSSFFSISAIWSLSKSTYLSKILILQFTPLYTACTPLSVLEHRCHPFFFNSPKLHSDMRPDSRKAISKQDSTVVFSGRSLEYYLLLLLLLETFIGSTIVSEK